MEILASCHSNGGTKFVELGAYKYFAQKDAMFPSKDRIMSSA